MSFQQTIICGNVGREDAQLRYTQTGVAVASFSVAVTKKWTHDGQAGEKTTWFKVTAWRELAEICAQYVKAGSKVTVIADEVAASAYMGKDGEPAASIELTARSVEFMSAQGERPRAERYEGIPF